MKQAVAWMLGLSCAMWAGCADDDPGNLPGPSPGAPLLTRVDAESPGGHCALGGTAVHSGLDANRNGTLDANEIQHTDYVCAASGDELWNGDFVAADWSEPAKVAALQHARVVLGSLTIAAPGAVTLPALELVRDDLSIAVDAALPALAKVGRTLKLEESTLSAPGLREIGSDLVDTGVDTGELALPSLLNIGRDLRVAGAVTALHLEELVAVGRDIQLTPTAPLAVVLPALTSAGGDVESIISQLTRLELPVLEKLPGRLNVWGGPVLTRISLPKAYQLGAVIVGGSALATLELGVHFVDGTFYVSDAPALTTLPLPELRSVGDAVIVQLTGITDLALPVLAFSRNCVLAAANPALRTLALPSAVDIGCLSVYDSPPLTSVDAPTIDRLGSLAILNAPALQAIDFAALREVQSTLLIHGTALADLSGLSGLTEVTQLDLERNPALRDLRSLAAIRRIGGLQLIENAAVTSFAGLEQLTHIPDFLIVHDNPALTSTRGLQNVTHLGYLDLTRNAALPALALPSLLSIDGELRISGMTSLVSLAGFDALRAVGGIIKIDDNAALPAAELDAFLARFPR